MRSVNFQKKNFGNSVNKKSVSYYEKDLAREIIFVNGFTSTIGLQENHLIDLMDKLKELKLN
jgi:hypothetical protein